MDRDARVDLSRGLRAERPLPRLHAESFAPWCEKARWALDHHGLAYRYREHVPLTGEVELRLAARRWRGRVTVPLLVDEGLRLMDSFEIARHAERVGQGAKLFPIGREQEVLRWNERSDALMVAGRAMLLTRLLSQPLALREQLPPAVPLSMRPWLTGVAAFGVRFLMRKHGVEPGLQHETVSRRVLDELRMARRRSEEHLIDGGLSFADIAMATALQFVLPVADRYMPLGRATREAWTYAALATEYPDLLAWRDGLYARYRAQP